MQNEVGKTIGEYLKRLRKPRSAIDSLRKPRSAIDSFRHQPSSMVRYEYNAYVRSHNFTWARPL